VKKRVRREKRRGEHVIREEMVPLWCKEITGRKKRGDKKNILEEKERKQKRKGR